MYPQVTQGAYSSMNCGYGYQKSNDGRCSQLGWYDNSYGCMETVIIKSRRLLCPFFAFAADHSGESREVHRNLAADTHRDYGGEDNRDLL